MPHLRADGGTLGGWVTAGPPARPRYAPDRPVMGEVRLGLGVPGYAHPLVAPMEWGELIRAGTRPAGTLHWSVLNVADGPGARPDPHCLETAGRLRASRTAVLGHLDLRYGCRPFGELVTDAHRFLEWYRVDGFYLDRCPTERSLLPDVRRTTATLGALSPDAHIVLGQGTHPYPGYVEVADQLVTYAGPWNDYRWSQVAEWTAQYPAECFCHLVHGVPRMHLDEAMRIARWQGAATVFFTDRTTWEVLPGYWDEIVSRIGHDVSE